MRFRRPVLRPTSLRAALVFDLAAIGISGAALLVAVLNLIIQNSFGTLEAVEVARDIDRARAALNSKLATTEAHVLDWGIWDETYSYLQGFEPGYETRNINAASFVNAEISCAAFVRFDRRERRAFCFDAETGVPDPALAKAVETAVTEIGLPAATMPEQVRAEYWQKDEKLYALATTPVFRSDGSGTAEGVIGFLHRIDAANLSEAMQASVRFDFEARTAQPQVVEHDDRLEVLAPVASAGAAPVAMVRFEMQRSVLAAGEHLRDLTVLAMLSLLAVLLALLGQRLSTHVLAPILGFHDHVRRIRTEGDLVPLEGAARADEIGALRDEFNAMVTEIEALRAANAAQSFALGREQSAIGLLHNLRNSLSPVRVILADLDRQFAITAPPEAARARAELADATIPAERRRRLVEYLAALEADRAEAVEAARGLVAEAARSLAEAIEALRAPRDPDRVDRNEACDLARALAQAAKAARFVDGPPVEVTIDCPPRLLVRGNRVLLAQVLDNLVVNATEAIRAAGRARGRITVTAERQPETGRCLVRLRDDGDGFDAATGVRLFERGFSTRSNKRGGLGLHWCANTLMALGGRLSLTSPGRGLGAVATLDLPAIGSETGAVRAG